MLWNVTVQSAPAEPLFSSDVWLRGSAAPADLLAILPTCIHPGSDWTPVDVQWFGLFIHPFPDFCFPVILCQICFRCSCVILVSLQQEYWRFKLGQLNQFCRIFFVSLFPITVLILHVKEENTVFSLSSAQFCAVAAPAEQRKPPHYHIIPLWCLPPVSCFGRFSATAPEHFALMKRCYSSGCDGC